MLIIIIASSQLGLTYKALLPLMPRMEQVIGGNNYKPFLRPCHSHVPVRSSKGIGEVVVKY